MTNELNQEFLNLIWISLTALLGHNFWLVAKNQSSKIRVEANTGHHFPGGESAVKPERVADFRIVSNGESVPLMDYKIVENSLVAEIETPRKSFYAAIELRSHPIELAAEKFAGYIADEDAAAFAGGEFDTPQRESYAKFAKVFSAVDRHDEIFNLAIGHRFEIVPQTAFSDMGKGVLQVQVLFENRPVAGVRVSSGAETSKGYAAHTRTDENGLAEIKIERGGLCFVRTHLIRRHADTENFEWESFWAALTFGVE